MKAAGELKRCGAGILLFAVLCCPLGGCSIEKVRAGDNPAADLADAEKDIAVIETISQALHQ